ncbi:aldo/keto reductase [Conexibacter sp. CPCC 206217]|uniref:aldo/keto reductase n=1 Tax=Conexibacter sp. CPCC 206217 TaxID=3064574 RepID=UPI0027241C8A|nr:aldo/keto reductase [Conexibacter sp. CPCC 206217]MDO8213162.1 aldo/keto reductase [Conexibacter sp. CPCC 206217]
MRTIKLTEGGPDVSALGFGCNNFGHNPFGNFVEYERCERVVHAALDLGYTLFDTADVYGAGESEEYLGRALGARRGEVMVGTKFGGHGDIPGAPDVPKGSAEYVRWACEGALRRLGTDYIDLFQIHEPDPVTPIEETLGALGELVGAGKVRYVGVAGFSAQQLEAAASAAKAGELPYPISSMTHYSLLSRQNEESVIPACERLGIRVHPWFVLESGLLTGKFRRGARGPDGARYNALLDDVSDAAWDALEGLQAFADARGISLVELAIGGIAAMPAVGVVIVGASTPEQAEANIKARDWTPTPAELAELRGLAWASPRG